MTDGLTHYMEATSRLRHENLELKRKIDNLERGLMEERRAFKSVQLGECANCYVHGIVYYDGVAHVCVDWERCFQDATKGTPDAG